MAPSETTPERIPISEINLENSDSLDEQSVIIDSRRELLAAGPKRSVKIKVKNSRKRGSEEVNHPSKVCHSCRNPRVFYLPCSRCSLRFCDRCLINRHGELMEVEGGENVRWVCPRCRGGCGRGCPKNCCNCSACRKLQQLTPTGQMHKTAINHGFNNVHDYLIHMETGESAAEIAKRKQGRGWTSVDSGILVVATEPGMEHRRTGPGWERKKSRSARLVKSSKLKVVRKSSASLKKQKMFSGEQMEDKFSFFETVGQEGPQNQTPQGHTFPLKDIEEKWADLPRDDPTFARQVAGAYYDSYDSKFV